MSSNIINTISLGDGTKKKQPAKAEWDYGEWGMGGEYASHRASRGYFQAYMEYCTEEVCNNIFLMQNGRPLRKRRELTAFITVILAR